MIRLVRFCLILMIFFLINSCRKGDYELEGETQVIRDNGNGTGTVTWTPDKSYLLEGKVFVNDGQVLTIKAGTVIRAKSGQGNASSALIVARGGKIYAEGTSDYPIIFTVEGDDLEGSVPDLSKGLWGGVIILGNAKLNNESGEGHIEGISLDEPRGIFGGSDDEDNSGIMRYVSIRHGGTNIGEGNEINGLTLGAVGSGTTISHIEIISNADDGIEFFGGTVNCRNIVVAFCGDDAFDYDLGYRGKGQFWLAIQDPAIGDKILEADGGVDPIIGIPYSTPEIYNATFIGRGKDINNMLVDFEDNAGGNLVNSLCIQQGEGIFIEYVETRQDSYSQFENGRLELKNNIFYDIADNQEKDVFKINAEPGVNITNQTATIQAYFYEAGNSISDPVIVIEDMTYFPIPQGDVSSNMAPYPEQWFDQVNYKGAFGSYNWLYGWTLLSNEGYIQ